jgi:hypothetical protein
MTIGFSKKNSITILIEDFTYKTKRKSFFHLFSQNNIKKSKKKQENYLSLHSIYNRTFLSVFGNRNFGKFRPDVVDDDVIVRLLIASEFELDGLVIAVDSLKLFVIILRLASCVFKVVSLSFKPSIFIAFLIVAYFSS